MMHFTSPPRMSNSSEGTLAPHLTHSYTMPEDDLSTSLPLSTQKATISFLNVFRATDYNKR
jgi:hypothetical protein